MGLLDDLASLVVCEPGRAHHFVQSRIVGLEEGEDELREERADEPSLARRQRRPDAAEDAAEEGVVPALVLCVVGDQLADGRDDAGVARDPGEDRRDERLGDDREEELREAGDLGRSFRLGHAQPGQELRLRGEDRALAGDVRDLALEVVGELRVPGLVGADLVGVLDHPVRELESDPPPADQLRHRVDRALLEVGSEVEVDVQALEQEVFHDRLPPLGHERVLDHRDELGREEELAPVRVLREHAPRRVSHAGATLPQPELRAVDEAVLVHADHAPSS